MTKKSFFIWAERYFYSPNFAQKCLAFWLLPLSLLYHLGVWVKFHLAKPKDFGIKVISVGNLIMGGSGKTPFVKFLYSKFSPQMPTFIVLRGYGRSSKGLKIVAMGGEILLDASESGDEAFEYAISLKNANVIVSEDRALAIQKAKEMGAKLVLLDDGFSKFNIQKFNILLNAKPFSYFDFCFPSGAYRYPKSFAKYADLVINDDDLLRQSDIANPTEKMVLITAIARPQRLKEHFDKCVGVEIFEDHHRFSESEITDIVRKYGATSVLVTMKDYAKIRNFKVEISIISLNLELNNAKFSEISKYINQNRDKIRENF